MALAMQYVGLTVGLSIAAILFRMGWLLLRPPRAPTYFTVQRGRRFRFLHMRFEDGQWAHIVTPMGSHDAWYWDKPLFGRD